MDYLNEIIIFLTGGGLSWILFFRYNKKTARAKSVVDDLEAHVKIIESMENQIKSLLDRVHLLEANCKNCEYREKHNSQYPIYKSK